MPRSARRRWSRPAPVAFLLLAVILNAVAVPREADAADPAGGPAPAASAAADATAVAGGMITGGMIDGWIAELAAEQFAKREAASRSLAAVGAAAIEPLRTAISRGDLEVSSRAVEILRGLLEADDPAVAAQAELALERLAEGTDATVARLADTTLDFHTLGMAEAARAKLESLGAVVTEGFLPSGRRGLSVILNASWTGTPEEFRLLARMRGVAHLGVHGVRLDPQGLAVLARMRGIERLELYGTKADDAAVATLRERLAPAHVDYRKGAKLGVAGTPGVIGPCTLNHVQEGSAAARAGLQMGDVVVEIDGVPVHTFEALTERVGRREPGEKIEVRIERPMPGGPPQRLTRTVELGGWE